MSNISVPYSNLQNNLLQHELRQDHAGCKSGEGGNQRSSQCVAGVFDLCGHEIDTHSIKDGLCTGHGNGCNQSDQRIRTKLFIEIQKKSGSG